MSIIELLMLIPLWLLIEHICVKWAIKHNKELFYDLHKKQIERELNKK